MQKLTIPRATVLFNSYPAARRPGQPGLSVAVTRSQTGPSPRGGNLNLLLYSVFRIGNATNNVTWQSYTDIAKADDVAWIVPLSLGDSHKGFRVLDTEPHVLTSLIIRAPATVHVVEPGDVPIDLSVEVLGWRLADYRFQRYRAGKVGDVEVKRRLAAALNAYLAPLRERRARLAGQSAYLLEILREGSRKARQIARKTFAETQEAMELTLAKELDLPPRSSAKLLNPTVLLAKCSV